MEIVLVKTKNHEALYIDDVKEMEADKLDLSEVLQYLKSYFDMEDHESFSLRVESKDTFDFSDDYYELLNSEHFWDEEDYKDFTEGDEE